MVGFIVTLFLAKVSSPGDSAIRLRSANFAIGSLVANHGPYEENKPVTFFSATDRGGWVGGGGGGGCTCCRDLRASFESAAQFSSE